MAIDLYTAAWAQRPHGDELQALHQQGPHLHCLGSGQAARASRTELVLSRAHVAAASSLVAATAALSASEAWTRPYGPNAATAASRWLTVGTARMCGAWAAAIRLVSPAGRSGFAVPT